jgi:CheY-like chemotaxis protein
LFQRTGADLYHASDGLEAVNQFRKIKNIDLVIMDIQLPEMDGYEATRVIRSMNSDIPVIAQTAFAMSDDREKMKLAGFDDYVSKPIDINNLLAIVHRWLTRSKTRITTPFFGN